MKQVIRISKSVPWALLGRLSLKLIGVMGSASIALLIFMWKSIIICLELITAKSTQTKETFSYDMSAPGNSPGEYYASSMSEFNEDANY